MCILPEITHILAIWDPISHFQTPDHTSFYIGRGGVWYLRTGTSRREIWKIGHIGYKMG